jgi:probable F420-dependent oxidoreductase
VAAANGGLVKLGIVCGLTAYFAGVKRIARHIEACGFESMWMIDHPIVPVKRASVYGGGGAMPPHYAHILDPFIGLAAAAGATTTLRLGTSIALVPERDPLVMAKEISTIDLVSNGRFEFGVGAGWIKEEGEILGVHWARRWAQTREYILAMKSCWTDEISEFHGEFVDFPPLYSDPKPVQTPHPPVLIAGEMERAAERIVEYGDGWMPRYDRIDLDAMVATRAQLSERYARAGRDFSTFTMSVFRCPPEVDAVADLAARGADRALLILPPVAEAEAIDTVSNWAQSLLPAAR